MKQEDEGNMITNWLEKNGNPEIMKQVEREAEELEIEEVAKNYSKYNAQINKAVIEAVKFGAKWQAERMYSEEDMLRFAQIYAVNKLDKTHVEKYKKQTK